MTSAETTGVRSTRPMAEVDDRAIVTIRMLAAGGPGGVNAVAGAVLLAVP